MEYRALLIEYRAFFIECRALLSENRALCMLIEYMYYGKTNLQAAYKERVRFVLIEYRAPLIKS